MNMAGKETQGLIVMMRQMMAQGGFFKNNNVEEKV
jgi:hypothetical protein